MKTYHIDGKRFSTIDEFFDEISRALIPNSRWGRNLNAFNDILRGGFGTPDEGFILVWKNSEISKERLGYPETIRQLERQLSFYPPLERAAVEAELREARNNQGETVFSWLIEIIGRHGPGGEEAEDGVILMLE